MRMIAIVIIASLVSATVLYFYDILISGFSRLVWQGKPLVSTINAECASAFMAITIGLGVLAESAASIWDKLVYWGQLIDNKIIKYVYGKSYFLDEASHLLLKTRLLFNRTNFHLQSIAIPTDNSVCNEKDLKKLSNKVKNIKNNCQKINTLLEHNRAKDVTNLKKQEHLKQLLNNLVSSNLEMSSWVESIADKMSSTSQCSANIFLKSPNMNNENTV